MSAARVGRPGSSRAFTLVELLVVIAICSVLAALLFSAGWYARQRARAFQCTVNLQQLGVAIALYVNDYQAIPLVYPDVQPGINGPRSKDPGGPNGPIVPPQPPDWFVPRIVLGDYIPTDSDVFECPIARSLCPASVDWRHLTPPRPGTDVLNPVEYWFNQYASGLKMTQVHEPPSKSLMMYDPLVGGWPWEAHLRRYNALFLDGHVKAYDWIIEESPWSRNNDWPPD